MSKSIQHTFLFAHSPEVVWKYLTKAELIEQWLMKNDFQPIVGYDFQFRTNPLPNFNFDGIVYCKVLELQTYKKLSYSWKTGPGNGKITIDSIVVWTLHEKDNGTELQLEHTGFKETDITMYSIMHDGWLRNIQKINELINALKHGATKA
jgi:uncharacterized protein YndB with AHSA1/START domain